MQLKQKEISNMKYYHQHNDYMSTNCSLKIGICPFPTSEFAMHWHNGVEMIYGYGSEYNVTVGTKTYHISDGDIMFVPSRSIHSFTKKDQPDPLYFILFKAEPIYSGGELFRNIDNIDLFNPIIKNTVIINKKTHSDLHHHLKNTVEQLIILMTEQPSGFRYGSVSKLYEIIELLYKFKIADNSFDDSLTEHQINSIAKAFEYIEDNYRNDIHITDVAEHCGFDNKYFGRLFFKTTGSYFKDFLNDFRIIKATEIMISNEMSVSHIAFECGFSSVSTFYRAFIKKHGCTPTQFIDMHKN